MNIFWTTYSMEIEQQKENSMRIMSGIIKKVLTEEQYKKLVSNEVGIEDITLHETIRKKVNANGEIIEYLPFRLSYREMDNYGNDKYIFNEQKQEYQKSFQVSPIIFAYGKEMRILLETEDFNPIKIVVDEIRDGRDQIYRAVCIQNQLVGLKKNYEPLVEEKKEESGDKPE